MFAALTFLHKSSASLCRAEPGVRCSEMVKILLVIILIMYSSILKADEEFLGKENPESYWYVDRVGSSCIPQRSKKDFDCRYAVSQIFNRLRMKAYILAQRGSGKLDDEGNSIFEVTDVIPHPTIPANYQFVALGCTFDDQYDPSIIAIAEGGTKSKLTKSISWAAKLDFETGKLNERSTEGIRCWAGYEG